MAKKQNPQPKENKKVSDLQTNTQNGDGQFLSTNQGLLINDNQNSLKAGERGATLLEDFILREKITHFDHERIPERIVHARGSGAHGVFELYEPIGKYTKAKFLNDTSRKTPVFVRFSTVAGNRGSTDLARDVRGFAVKFYTEEGNYDLVGNNIPVFFIQDAMKFPDLVHAVKPEPHHEMPQAASAHDTFWDFISLMPESMHMIMWTMSDRAIPRSYRMMEGFGVNTFRFLNEKGESHFVKFHWKPKLGTHAVAWEEAQQISGKDPDFHRRDLWEAIETGHFPEWDLGIQVIPEADEHKFDFDLLDPTKLIPEEIVPVQRIGKMTLNRNPDNFFAETEQIAFHPGHLVPGIDFTNDPLLQGRLFSYTDTQLSRLGSPNFHEIPINRPIVPVMNNQRDGHMRQTINSEKTSYHPNSISGGCPFQAKISEGGFSSYQERIDAKKIRDRSESFSDHFSQATLFYNSQTEPEQNHIINAFTFELGKVERHYIRERMVGILSRVDKNLEASVAANLGIQVTEPERPLNHGVPADADQNKYEPTRKKQSIADSKALSMLKNINGSIESRCIAVLTDNGVDEGSLNAMLKALEIAGAQAKIIAQKPGTIKGSNGKEIAVDHSLVTVASVLFDAIYVPNGDIKTKNYLEQDLIENFINEAFKHCKPIAADGLGAEILKKIKAGHLIDLTNSSTGSKMGIEINTSPEAFVKAIGKHRFWEREKTKKVKE